MSNQINTETTYFHKEKRGTLETDETLKLAKKRADQLGISSIVVASIRGETALKASEVFDGYNLVIVTGVTENNVQNFPKEVREAVEAKGGKIVTAAHAFGTLGRSVNKKFGVIQVDEIIAHVLRLFSAGVKVACEVSCMAVDAGLIRTDEEVIGIGGKGGADSAVVIKPSNTHLFFESRILEIICKPR
ncbi:MAG: pyruvate kinase alpha/beta domain-containing protein [Candidatus Bathyarchaeota archaeon]